MLVNKALECINAIRVMVGARDIDIKRPYSRAIWNHLPIAAAIFERPTLKLIQIRSGVI